MGFTHIFQNYFIGIRATIQFDCFNASGEIFTILRIYFDYS